MKVQASQNSNLIVKTFNQGQFKTTSLCIHRQSLSENTKLDTSQLLILKSYACNNQNISKQTIYRWVEALTDLQQATPILSASISQNKQRIVVCVTQKYLPYGNLSEIIDPEWQIDCDLLLNLANTIKKFHDKSMVIANLKPENILLTKNNKQVLINDPRMCFLERIFEGNAQYAKAKRTLYKAPYIVHDQYIDEAGDILALGLIFLEIATRQRLPDKSVAVLKDRRSRLQQYGQTTLQHGLSTIIGGMVKKNFRQRLSIDEVISELQTIKKMVESNEAPKTKKGKLTKFYLPLIKSSHNYMFYIEQFTHKFSRKQQQQQKQQIQIMANENYELLKLKVTVQGCPLLSTFTYEQLPEELQKQFRNVQELYCCIKQEQSSLDLTNTGFLMLRILKHQKEEPASEQQTQKNGTL